ncbi:MAG: transketolase [Candidatus Levybacteria bacterium CG_4_9_14_3_um_filter_35_16]|nr:MAG: transketolase [Candidatus Levybacteria bacterium CG22_combo_CG10-13_8_21_14_all_35_11]PJA90983.1 MAG: transketolase [Candidatus Levybacteria bacterium CG_4_9_14_3_um_filter_35_16]PJC54001.1 MAG: transketolase [Candidatus Levybacteria bacterium CG_4_9_14_0_2_um_filter_35_21]
MREVNEKELKRLEQIANKIRQLIIESLREAKSGHTAGPLGMADIFSALYFFILNHDSKNPNWPERDRLVLSNGHICPVQYVALALAGYFPIEELMTLRKLNSRLQGHPHRGSLPGIETTSGPLGEGLSQATGMALAAKMDNKKYFIYCITSDGEHEEGNHWEAVLLAGKKKLNNLIQIVDRNNIQITGFTEDIMPLEPLKKKYEAFNWNVLKVNGNNIKEFILTAMQAQAFREKPTVIIAHTVPGMGVSFMENDFTWHGKTPNETEAKRALEELEIIEGMINNKSM